MGIDLTVLSRAFEGVFAFVLIGCLGYFLAKRGWFSNESMGLVSRLITNVAIPAYLFHNIVTSFDRDELFAMAPGLIAPFVSIGLTVLVGWTISRLIGSRAPGLFVVGFSFSNSINLGLPLNLALFGPDGAPFVILYFIGNTSLFWTVGNYLIARDGSGGRVELRQSVAKVLSPPTLALFAATAALIIRLPLPAVVSRGLQTVGNMNAGLVMLTLGATIFQMGLAGLKADREMLLIAFGKFVVCPLGMIAVSLIYPMPALMRNVFIIQSCMPVMTNSVLQAIYHKADVDYATRSVCLTTILSIVVIPVYMVLAEGNL